MKRPNWELETEIEANAPKNLKGILVSIYKGARIGDCTNGGVTSKAVQALLVGEGMPEIFEESDNFPTLLLQQNIGELWRAVPKDSPTGRGWMMGGNFIYTSDSRFREICPYPIPVHDRQEF